MSIKEEDPKGPILINESVEPFMIERSNSPIENKVTVVPKPAFSSYYNSVENIDINNLRSLDIDLKEEMLKL